MVRIRLKRFGHKNHPFWRINAIDGRTARDGMVLEELGFYDPKAKAEEKQVLLDKTRYAFWVGKGAQPTDTVKGLFKRAVDTSAPVAPVSA